MRVFGRPPPNLDKDGAEGQHAAHDDVEPRVDEPAAEREGYIYI